MLWAKSGLEFLIEVRVPQIGRDDAETWHDWPDMMCLVQ